ncbi:MAG TPA: phosphomannomutase [Verrucomicrobiales bacterium]|nr:phosphomannomutase [Verrucomicrobiales bacterium]HCN76569.1 phosphomannomutase [Verrucomicrobiales bacterium]HRJ09754.1 phospho-sugar mutase [Prosthecobacter sp.]HRK17079.1 phospho-sugar mutase [Prosthecobacter sp.]
MTLEAQLQAAADADLILKSTLENSLALLSASKSQVYRDSIQELVDAKDWSELDDRFYQTLKFGTGGLRGRTIGMVVTKAELGSASPGQKPDHPCVGTNAMNFYNVGRATRGLVSYIKKYRAEAALPGRPAIVISHDTRLFSEDFARHAARIATENGVDVHLFDGCRATPEMSLAVRHLRADAGVMLTASHNPMHDNGFKVNFNDGAGIVEPHASGIIREVMSITDEEYTPLPEAEQGRLVMLGAEMDEEYLGKVQSMMLQPELLRNEKARALKIVFTALHGTGGVLVPVLLRRLGFNFLTVPEQDVRDGRFPTVDSPNPENAPALQMAVDLADKEGADIVIGTDPDCDRMGVGVRDAGGKMILLTGNQTGSLMCWYRLKTMFDLGILNESNRKNAVILKTFVTSPMQDAIAARFGVPCVNTLTGFKWISSKLAKYEAALPEDIRAKYRDLSAAESRSARLQHSKFLVFGGEESYGYMGDDFSRDKDGNGAVVMFAELAAYAASRGLTVAGLLDEVYCETGYFLEVNKSKFFEGAAGAAKIAKLADSYGANPPTQVDGCVVARVRDFRKPGIVDEEGEPVSTEKMLFVDLADGRSFAVRPSGTEPKIKYYMFARKAPAEGTRLSSEELAAAKTSVRASLDSMWSWLEKDIESRLME